MKLPISVIVLTLNEEKNLGKCLESVRGIADEVIVVDDTRSTDCTLEIAERFGARTFRHEFVNQAEQFNWALDHTDPKGAWILRLDADEVLTPELSREIAEILPKTPPEVSGFYLKRRVYFMGRWIKHGGYYPTWILRLWRRGAARIERREVDEHTMLLTGEARRLRNDFIDEDRKGLEWWTAKQNTYSTREARERIKLSGSSERRGARLGGEQAEQKRWMKHHFYLKLPPFFRACAYFTYRYFLRLGFLDGKEGLIFHFLQGFWHQFLTDAKTYEILMEKKAA
jgi:glycosyltransferase involved in cell wall biosynthesis